MRVPRIALRVADAASALWNRLVRRGADSALEDYLSRMPKTSLAVRRQLGRVTAREVQEAYFIGYDTFIPFVDNSRTEFRWTHDEGRLGWNVVFYDYLGQPINRYSEQHGLLPIRRQLLDGVILRSKVGVRGQAAWNRLVCISPNYQGRRLGHLLHERESRLFSKWGAAEIQLEAECEARTSGVWFRKGYRVGTHDEYWLRLKDLWDDFQRLELATPEHLIVPLPDEWERWDPGFRGFLVNQPVILALYIPLP